jgi:hypothetical protein
LHFKVDIRRLLRATLQALAGQRLEHQQQAPVIAGAEDRGIIGAGRAT